MKLQRKMVTVNLAIHINKDDPKQCGNITETPAGGLKCRFLLEEDGHCVLFDKPLKVDKKDEQLNYLRCRPCLLAEPA